MQIVHLKSILIYFIYWQILAVSSDFNMSAYTQMPPLYDFEDYDACLKYNQDLNKNQGTYCMVFAEVIPNDNSRLWQQIADFSSNKLHFRHDHLFFGICLQHCETLLDSLSELDIQQLYSGKIHDNEIATLYEKVHKRIIDDRAHYEQIVGSCLNYKFQHKYNLSVRTLIEYCENNKASEEYDTWDIIMFSILIALVFLNISSTLYDFHLKLNAVAGHKNNTFYKTSLKIRAQKILTSFSICRNYYRLIQPSANKYARDLRFFDGFRVVVIFLVIFAHVLMTFMATQVSNPDFYESFLHRTETSIFENGASIIQIFFIMSGFLLYLNFCERKLVTEQSKIVTCIAVYFKIFIYRYLRLLPSLLFVIFFNATLLTYLQDGPFWRHYTEAERTFSREYWWKNVFFINNFLMKESSLHQTWYLATDMQLFELYLIVMIFTAKYPKLKNFAHYLLLALSVFVIMFATYFLKHDAVYHSNPENYRYLYFRNAETFYDIYVPFYTNLGGYLFGLCCAEIYLKAKHNTTTQKRYDNFLMYWKYIWWLLFPVAFGSLFAAGKFMSHEFEKPSICVALFASVYRHFWIIFWSALLLSMSFKIGWLMYEMASSALFRPLSRISYQTYLWHIVVLRFLAGCFRQPIYVNRFYLICIVILTFILSNVIGFFVALFFEYPITELVKCFFTQSRSDVTTNSKDNNEVFSLQQNVNSNT